MQQTEHQHVRRKDKIAYVMSRFPHLPETFILREMNELERQGYQIVLYPLIPQEQAVVHPEARPWIERMQAIPMLSWGVVVENLRRALKQPRAYFSLWAGTMRGNWKNPKFLARAAVILPKAVYTARQMQAEGVEHVHAHYATHPALFAWMIHRLTGLPYSITVHAHDIFVDQTMLETKVREASFVVAISEYNRQFLGRLLGPWALEKTRVVHCGIHPQRYGQALRNGNEPRRLEIVNVGSLQPYKGQRWLVQACDLLRQRGVPFRCQIVGEGEERPQLERQIRELGLEEQVVLAGALAEEQVAQVMASASCYVQPSVVQANGKMEGIPVAIMEALAAGLPVVATRLSGIPELVIDGETGYLVPPEDAQAIAGCLAEIASQPQQAARLAENGRRLVEAEFHIEKNVLELGGLFN